MLSSAIAMVVVLLTLTNALFCTAKLRGWAIVVAAWGLMGIA